MGLDATVFKNINSIIKVIPEDDIVLVDPLTGEYEFKDRNKPPCEIFEASSEFLGNIATIGYVREILENKLPEDSIIIQKVIYSGSHSGDILPFDFINKLKMEINQIQNEMTLRDDSTIESFMKKLSNLVEAAIQNNNPIVFT